MAKSDATIIDAGGRELRVSSPDRVIFPETERTEPVTKLDVVKYYLSVQDGIMIQPAPEIPPPLPPKTPPKK